MVCAIIGDSIGVAVHMAAPECAVIAKVGITSKEYAKDHPEGMTADLFVISLGANDFGVYTLDALRLERLRLHGKVVWLMPAIDRCDQRNAIRTVAWEFGDRIIDTEPYVPNGNMHPTRLGAEELMREVFAND